MAKKVYTFRAVYIGIVGPENENGECRDSIQNLQRRPGDSPPQFIRATKGYEARQMHLNNFIASTQYDGILLLDIDQKYNPDYLERLRAHGVAYVTGYTMRRRYSPVMPLWFKRGPKGKWPMVPWTAIPESGKLYAIGAAGWGGVLIHRDVIEAVRPLLKGELEVLEDDLDIYPYDLTKVMGAVRGLNALIDERPSPDTLYPALEAHVKTLRGEIRPLRAAKDIVGSDLRYPFFAREAGFTLWGDPDAQSAHMLNYPLQASDYAGAGEEYRAALEQTVKRDTGKEARDILAKRKLLEVKP